MNGDVVKRTVALGDGQFEIEEVLRWMAGVVRKLREGPTAECGKCGHFRFSQEAVTVEISTAARTQAAKPRKTLDFVASDALLGAIERGVATDGALDGLKSDDVTASCFARALAMELILNKRAAIGNFGNWSVGQMPTLELFVRFRPHAAVSRLI